MSELGNVKIVATTEKEGYIVEVEIKKMTVRFIPVDDSLNGSVKSE